MDTRFYHVSMVVGLSPLLNIGTFQKPMLSSPIVEFWTSLIYLSKVLSSGIQTSDGTDAIPQSYKKLLGVKVTWHAQNLEFQSNQSKSSQIGYFSRTRVEEFPRSHWILTTISLVHYHGTISSVGFAHRVRRPKSANIWESCINLLWKTTGFGHIS